MSRRDYLSSPHGLTLSQPSQSPRDQVRLACDLHLLCFAYVLPYDALLALIEHLVYDR